MLIGHGWDLHQHSDRKTLILGGVKFEEDGFEGHSDGDILIHALCDALLGATGKKDLGHYFPSDESTPKDIPSTKILSEILHVIEYENFTLMNIDITIITQKFNVQEKENKIIENLSKLLGVPLEIINVKGKSSDDYGIIGDQKASLAIVSLLLENA
jgi:2-C-methyl-D-erythritol 2,4-cyclodiphosphate synthase